jgi:hypothetical protein
MRPGFMRFVLVACFLCTVEVSAIAQDPHSPQTDDEGPALEECRAEPEGQSGIDQGKDAAEHDTTVLEQCKGVLKPPPTGDSEMVAPAPNLGTTPVIPPGAMPDQLPIPDDP